MKKIHIYIRELNIGLVLILALSFIAMFSESCKKVIEIPAPVSSITTSKVFSTDDQAISVLGGIYTSMINSPILGFGNGAITAYCGMSADELNAFDQNYNDYLVQFQDNNIDPTNVLVSGNLWTQAYFYIYTTNAAIEGLSTSSTVTDSVKKELIGESKFIRAFCYFYLVNLFGDIPLVTTTNYNKTVLLPRTKTSDIYHQIISDLTDAQNILPPDYSVGHDERIIPNKWAATALLARAYLYNQEWSNSEDLTTSIINNTSLFSLKDSLNEVFLANSSEAIWQLKQNNSSPPYNATAEGHQFIPFNSSFTPIAYLTPQLLTSFETNDKRRRYWLDSTIYNSTTYYYPFKYNIGPPQEAPFAPITQYYMMLRLAEQYLIRAEAETKLGDFQSAADDLNIIRNRAGLTNTNASTESDLLIAIAHERQTELFAEWGHRWLDLKRTNQATTVLSSIKLKWTPYAQLYPIPINELKTDPNLSQNEGY